MYAEKPLCHGSVSPVFKTTIEWEVRKDTNLRHCSYCGSLHPEDLLTVLKNGGHLEGSDWKYGWPHKYYVEGIPNPVAGEEVEMGSRSNWDEEKGERVTTPIMGIAGQHTHGKFYTKHLEDLLGQPEFEEVARAVHDYFNGEYYPKVAFIDEGDGRMSYVRGSEGTFEDKIEFAKNNS